MLTSLSLLVRMAACLVLCAIRGEVIPVAADVIDYR